MNHIYKFLIAFVVLLLIFLSNFFRVKIGFVQVKNGQNSTRIKSVEENDLRLNLAGEGTDSFLLQNYKPILKTSKKKVKKNGQNSTRIESVEKNGLRLNLDGEDTDSFLLKNYKPILNARKKKVKEVCQKYNLASGTIPNFRNIYCTFQYKVRKFRYNVSDTYSIMAR